MTTTYTQEAYDVDMICIGCKGDRSFGFLVICPTCGKRSLVCDACEALYQSKNSNVPSFPRCPGERHCYMIKLNLDCLHVAYWIEPARYNTRYNDTVICATPGLICTACSAVGTVCWCEDMNYCSDCEQGHWKSKCAQCGNEHLFPDELDCSECANHRPSAGKATKIACTENQ